MAQENNGTLRSAELSTSIATANVRRSFANFLPTVTPRYSYTTSRTETDGRTFGGSQDGSSAFVSANWQLLDAGQRMNNYAATRSSAESTRLLAVDRERSVLFTVHQQYFQALLQQELVRNSEAQVERANKILEQTIFQVEIGQSAGKDVLQARADALNAKVTLIEAQNSARNAVAALQATIGWPEGQPFPGLATYAGSPNPDPIDDIDLTIRRALDRRYDLRAARQQVDADRYQARSQRIDAGLTWSLDATYQRQVEPTNSDFRQIGFFVSYPLFDGAQRRESARIAQLQYEQRRAELSQQELNARAEIEQVLNDYNLGEQQLEAAKLALEAARLNYEAVIEGQREGASDLIDVLTAQTTLVAAENNYSRAVYSFYTTEVRMRLVTGEPLLGQRQ